MTKLRVATVQCTMSADSAKNIECAQSLVITAAKNGARLILLPELFATPYFCKKQNADYFALAHAFQGNPIVKIFSDLAKKYQVVLPVSFFERAGQCYFNSLVMIDADGAIGDVYRKSHIPDGPGYQEKFYFSPGDTGFKVWQTQVGKIGAAICWDQWFPEAARIMTLKGAEILCYPTAIGSEPEDAAVDSAEHWQITMRGHAAANIIPVMASNRIGCERDQEIELEFYGSSFICDHQGKIICTSGRNQSEIQYADLDLERSNDYRRRWGLFRDRRPELYQRLLQL